MKLLGIFSCILLTFAKCDDTVTRMMYDSMSMLVGEDTYPESLWIERQECFNKISPGLIDTLDLAWQGFIKYWERKGARGDMWVACEDSKERWFERNCTMQPGIEMAIWEPCNYVSNLAYDRLVLEMCNQENWTLGEKDVQRIAEAFAIVTFGSSFMHGSETRLGKDLDTKSNDLFAYILHQAALINIPYDPVLHDLSLTPRNRSAAQIVEYWLEIFSTKDVTEWTPALHDTDIPPITFIFSGILTHLMVLDFGTNTTITIAKPLMELFGVDEESRTFIFDNYLPKLDSKISHIQLSLLEKAELTENTIGSVMKLLYAFFWQESVIDLGNLNTSPEINAAGAAYTPTFNMFANNLTRWDLTVEDVQLGGGYPGHEGCNKVIPHAKWHAQTAASLADMTRLMDFVLYLERKYSI